VRKTKLHIILSVITFVVVFFVQLHSANAQSVGFSTNKSILDLEIPAGGSYEEQIVVFNSENNQPIPIHIELSLWDLDENSDDIEFVIEEPALNATKWFTLTNGADFILDKNEDREVKFQINVPQNTSPGSYLVMMRFQAVPPNFYFQEEGTKFIPEIGTLFFIKVPLLSLDGNKSLYGANIDSLEPEGNKIPAIAQILPRADAGVFDNAIRKLMADVTNSGIYHFKMSGTLEIKNIFGMTVNKIDLPGRYLLPNKSRNIEVTVLPPPETQNLPLLSRIAKNSLFRLKNNTYFGPYSATMILSVPENVPVVESINFWIIPWRFILVLTILVLGIVFIVKNFGKRIKSALAVLFRRKVS
jgi:hypothetical protein